MGLQPHLILKVLHGFLFFTIEIFSCLSISPIKFDYLPPPMVQGDTKWLKDRSYTSKDEIFHEAVWNPPMIKRQVVEYERKKCYPSVTEENQFNFSSLRPNFCPSRGINVTIY